MQWDLLPPLSLDSGRVSVAGLIQPAYDVGGDSYDYAINGDTLDFAISTPWAMDWDQLSFPILP